MGNGGLGVSDRRQDGRRELRGLTRAGGYGDVGWELGCVIGTGGSGGSWGVWGGQTGARGSDRNQDVWECQAGTRL